MEQERQPPRSDAEMLDRFEKIYSGAISDVLDKMELRLHSLPTTIRPLSPGMRFAGRALPCVGEPTDSTDPDVIFVPLLKMLGEVTDGKVVVTRSNDDQAAQLGELSSTTIKVRGGRGAIIDGGCRDIEYILRLGLPVFCRYTTANDCVGRWKGTAYNVPIDIGGVAIRPDDVIVADYDGVLVIPSEVAVDVLLESEALFYTENLVRKMVME